MFTQGRETIANVYFCPFSLCIFNFIVNGKFHNYKYHHDLFFISHGDGSKWRGKCIVVKMVKQEQNSCGSTFCSDPVMPFFTFSFNHHQVVIHT